MVSMGNAVLTHFRSVLPKAGLPVLLVVLGLSVFWVGLQGGYFFDDGGNLVHNPDWRLTSLQWQALWRAAFSGIASDGGRPLAMLSFGLNHYLTGDDPFWLKLSGLALHLFNGVLVYWLCRRLFALAAAIRGPAPEDVPGTGVAWLVALAWTIHPLQVSSALYIVQRMEVGAHTFVLLALLAYLRGRDGLVPSSSAGNVPARYGLRWGWLTLAGLSTLIGLGFKESALLAPGYALVIELVLLRFRGADGRPARVLVGLYVLALVLALAMFLLKILPGALQPEAYLFRDFSVGQRLLTQGPVLLMYLKQALLPWPGDLLFYYDNFPVSHDWLAPATLLAWLTLAALLLAGFLARRRWPLVALGIGWFFMAHVLTSNVIPLELAYEHRNYFALLGVLLAVAQILVTATGYLRLRVRVVLALALLALLGLLTNLHARTWGDSIVLAVALAERNPTSYRAQYELGRVYLAASESKTTSPYWSKALDQMQQVSALPGGNGLAEQSLIIMAARTGQSSPEELWGRYRDKLTQKALGPESINALYAVQDCRVKGSCKLDDSQLFNTFLAVLQRNPDSALAHSMYANFAFNVIGDRELAFRMLREAIRLSGDNPQYRLNLAKLLTAANIGHEERDALLAQVKAANIDGRYDTELSAIDQMRRQAAAMERQNMDRPGNP